MKVQLLFLASMFVLGATDDYSDSLRYYMMPLAAAAYSDKPEDCLSPMGIQVYSKITVRCDSHIGDHCFGYTAIDSANQAIIISFRGTDKTIQLLTEWWDDNDLVPFTTGGQVAGYFFTAFNTIWINGTMKDDINFLKNKYPSYQFFVTGHSLGGAMAALAAGTIASLKITLNDISLYTFGQPRTGNRDFATAFNALIPGKLTYSNRIIHDRDIVPHLPAKDSYGYYHHLFEIWFENDMGVNDPYVVCNHSDGEDAQCSDSDVLYCDPLDCTDHLNYFGVKVSDFGINGCVYPGLERITQLQFWNKPKPFHLRVK